MISKQLKHLREFVTKNYEGKCKNGNYDCCGGVMMTPEEKERIDKVMPKAPYGKGKDYCEYLTKEGKCSVYDERPIICRSFGLIKEMNGPCKGCTCKKQMTSPAFMRAYITTCTVPNEWAKKILNACIKKNEKLKEQLLRSKEDTISE